MTLDATRDATTTRKRESIRSRTKVNRTGSLDTSETRPYHAVFSEGPIEDSSP